MNNPYPHRIEPDVPTPRLAPQRAILLGVIVVLVALAAAVGFFVMSRMTTEYEPVETIQTQIASEPITVTGNNVEVTVPANGQPVTVSGNNNTVTVTGDCPSISASGNANTVYAETVGEITVSGNANAVRWSKERAGNPPTVSTSGNANTVSRQE